MKTFPSVLWAVAVVLLTPTLAWSKQQRIGVASAVDSVRGVLEITSGYGGKLMILSHPRITTPRRNIVRVDSFYFDSTRPGASAMPPQYHLLLQWPPGTATGTDTVGNDPILITNGGLGGGDVFSSQLFSPNMRRVLNASDITTIGVLTPSAATAEYGKHGRNGAIIMTTKRPEDPDDPGGIVSGGAAFHAAVRDTTRPMPGQVEIRFVLDTTGHVDPTSFVVLCRRTPGAFLEPAQKEAILGAVWQPSRLRGRLVRDERYMRVNTLVDSIRTAGDSISLCHQ